jgi:hypothetical protein
MFSILKKYLSHSILKRSSLLLFFRIKYFFWALIPLSPPFLHSQEDIDFTQPLQGAQQLLGYFDTFSKQDWAYIKPLADDGSHQFPAYNWPLESEENNPIKPLLIKNFKTSGDAWFVDKIRFEGYSKTLYFDSKNKKYSENINSIPNPIQVYSFVSGEHSSTKTSDKQQICTLAKPTDILSKKPRMNLTIEKREDTCHIHIGWNHKPKESEDHAYSLLCHVRPKKIKHLWDIYFTQTLHLLEENEKKCQKNETPLIHFTTTSEGIEGYLASPLSIKESSSTTNDLESFTLKGSVDNHIFEFNGDKKEWIKTTKHVSLSTQNPLILLTNAYSCFCLWPESVSMDDTSASYRKIVIKNPMGLKKIEYCLQWNLQNS